MTYFLTTYGKFTNHNDTMRLISGLSFSYCNNGVFVIMEYVKYSPFCITVRSPRKIRMVNGTILFTDLESDMLESILKEEGVGMFVLTGFHDYQNIEANAAIDNLVDLKKLNIIYYDDKYRKSILNSSIRTMATVVRKEHFQKQFKKSCLKLKRQNL